MFIFYTSEGWTVSPKGVEVENFQVLGFACGDHLEGAKEKLLEDNPWILEMGFDPEYIIGRRMVR